MHAPRRFLATGATVLAGCLAAAGCTGQDDHTARGSATHSPSAAASASPTPAGSPAASRSPAAAGAGQADGRCHTGGLSIRSRDLGAATGNRYAVIVFTNDSGHSCRVYGFPGMQLLNGHGGTVATRVVRDPSSKPRLVTLADGGSAWTRVGWSSIPAGGEPQTGPCEPAPASAEVTPPDETRHTIIKWRYGPACQHGRIVVTALAAGTGPARE